MECHPISVGDKQEGSGAGTWLAATKEILFEEFRRIHDVSLQMSPGSRSEALGPTLKKRNRVRVCVGVGEGIRRGEGGQG